MSQGKNQSPPVEDIKDVFIKNFWNRCYRVLDYFSLFIYIILVSIGALAADNIIVYAITFTIKSSTETYPVVKQIFDLFQIGSSILVLIGAIIHALFSTWSQVSFELDTIKNSK